MMARDFTRLKPTRRKEAVDKIRHTPLPWYIPGYNPALINSVEGSVASCTTMPDTEAEDAANAAFIVRACNSHDELLGALRELLANGGPISDPVSRKQSQDRARAAIKKATAR